MASFAKEGMAWDTIECVLPELCEHLDMESTLRFRTMSRWFTEQRQHGLFARSLLRSWLAQAEHPQWKQRSEVFNLLARLASPSRFGLTESQSATIMRRPAFLPILCHITETLPAIVAGCPKADQLTDDEALSGLVLDALAAITHVAQHGDKVAIEFASRWAGHRDSEVQRLAARTLGLVANIGDKDVIRTLLHEFDDDTKAEVRLAKVVALQRVAEVGDEDVITCLCNCLKKRDAGDASYAALTALNHLATVGSEAVVAQLCDLLQDRYQPQEMRLACIELIRTMAPKGDRTALSALLCCMQDVNPYRGEADMDVSVTIALTCAEVIRQIAAVGDAQVVGTLEASLQRSRVVEEVRDEMLSLLDVLRID